MADQLSSDQIAHLARLSRIELTGEESDRFAGQLSSVVGYVEQLSSVDTNDVVVSLGLTGLKNALADDQPRVEGDPLDVSREALLAGAPAHTGGYIEVRAVMGDTDEVTGA